MSGDLISRQKTIEILTSMMRNCFPEAEEELDAVITTVREIPSAESERTAKVKLQDICWEDIRRYKEGMCASCGRSVYNHAKYCDECGCRLEWDE